MNSNLRARSVSRSRVVKNSELTPGGKVLDPHALLADVLDNIQNLDAPISVTLSDGAKSVSYLLSVLMSREFEVIDDVVRFGFVRLDVNNLRAVIKFEVAVDPTQWVPAAVHISAQYREWNKKNSLELFI
jgi:hypothetical protein